MLLSLPHRLRILPVLLLFSLTALARSNDSLRFKRHNISLNLAPGIRREVQLFYERRIGLASSIEVIVGTRVPSGGDEYAHEPGLYSPGYKQGYFALPYEKGLAGGIHWKKYRSRRTVQRNVLFTSFGALYRYGFFNDKCYSEETGSTMASWAQIFSLRKHEINARVLLGVRRDFPLRGAASALSFELAGGFGYRVRFGESFVQRSRGATYGCEHLYDDQSIRNEAHRFAIRNFALPVNLKIGYSWGG